MENSVLTHLLLQANVGEILGRAERDRLASKAPPSTLGMAVILLWRLLSSSDVAEAN